MFLIPKISKNFLFAIRLIVILLLFSNAYATDKILLDSLVKNGILTQTEASNIQKESVGVVLPDGEAQKIRLLQFWHLRYQYLNQDYSNIEDRSHGNFMIRRVIPVVIADFSDHSSAMLTFFWPGSFIINTARYEHKFDGDYLTGSLWVGYEPVFFCMEENESGMELMTPDRSMINMYFGGGDHSYDSGYALNFASNPAFSGYHAGVFWNGKLPKNKSVIYRLSLTNSKPDKLGIQNLECNGIAVFGSLGWDKKEEDKHLRAGINMGYSSRVVSAVSGRNVPDVIGAYGDAYGVNPYILWKYKRITFNAEFVATAMKYGKSVNENRPIYSVHSSTAVPWGFYILGGYKFDITPFGQLEPVFRYLRLHTDGRGITENVLYRAKGNDGIFDKVDSFYCGVNWYVIGNTLKYQIGAEYARFRDGVLGLHKKDDVLMFVAQMQIVF